MTSSRHLDRTVRQAPDRPPYAWAVEETTGVISGYFDGASMRELSVAWGRSPHHVVQHLAWQLLGVSPADVNPLAPRFREPWSDSELVAIVGWLRAGVSLSETAERLQRDLTEVAERILLDRLGVALPLAPAPYSGCRIIGIGPVGG